MPIEFPGHKPISRSDAETAEALITVEGEPWTGLLVVADIRGLGMPEYGLVQASEWQWTGDEKDPDRTVTVWKGPQKPDELIARKHLAEMECQTVLVDENGFYTCPPLIYLIKDEVLKRAPKLFDEEANQRAAESRSYVDDEIAREKYDTDDVLAIAECGSAYAVNGEYTNSKVKVPRGFVKAEEEGGRTLGGDEEQVEIDHIAEYIARDITEELKRPVSTKEVEKIIHEEYGGEYGYIMWSSDGGYVSVYIPRKALKAYEKRENEAAKQKTEREIRERTARRAKEDEERRQKMRKGGFPGPKDWSPTGEL